MDANNLDMFVTNYGSFAGDRTTFEPGLLYPRGTTRAVIYTAGIWVGAMVNDTIQTCIAEYSAEYTPGPMYNGTFLEDQPAYKNFRLEVGQTSSDDYLNWPSAPPPVGQGAPLDSQGNPLEPGDLTLWSVYNDADPLAHTNSSAGGTKPLGLEIQQTSFAMARSGALGNMIFLKFRLINKGGNFLDRTFVSIWVDPDLGDASDDLVGCDTTLSLGFCFNESNNDAVYGSAPPAVGFAGLRGPVIQRSPGVYDTLGMTSFNKYINGEDPTSPTEAYHLMQGLEKDGTPLHVNHDPNQPITTFQFPGDPVTGTGWLDSGGDDRRMQLSTGPFNMAPGDTQEVACVLIVGQGTDRLSSITALRNMVPLATYFLRCAPCIPLAISVALESATAEPDVVHLRWSVSEAQGTVCAVERRTAESDWIQVGLASPDGLSSVHYDDRAISAGQRYAYRLLVQSTEDQAFSNEVWVSVPGNDAPFALNLDPAYPNPFQTQTSLNFGVPTPGHVELRIYSVTGRRVTTIVDQELPAGWNSVPWNGRDASGQTVASGTYFARLKSAGRVQIRKIVIAK